MKISKAIFGANDSFYLEYWPKQAEACKDILGFDPVLFWVTNEDSDFYNDGHGLVKKIKKIDWVDDKIQACIVRFWGPVFFPDDVCILCDIDMFMFSRKYFIDQVKDIPEEDLVVYTSDAYDRSRIEMKNFYSDNNLPFETNMYSVCYNAAKGNTFIRLMDLNDSFESFLKNVSERPGYHMSWYVDEFFFSDCVNNKDHKINIHFLKRGVDTPFLVPKRIEKWGLPDVEYHIHQLTLDRDKWGPYDEDLLREDYYIDFHAPRPYSAYQSQIDKVVNTVKNFSIKKYTHKKISLISTFCDTPEKQDILLDNIRRIKKIGIDVMAISPNFIQVPDEIIKECDYFFYTKENPLLKWPTRAYTHWYEFKLPNGKITTLQRGLADYGWAGLYQVKKLSQIALSFDYDIFYHLIYDLEIDEFVENVFKSDNYNIIHPRIDLHSPENIFDSSLHLMVFDRELMEKIEKEITLEEYLRTNGVAEGEVSKWKEKYDIITSDHSVRDKIFYWGDYDFFDYSPFPEFKLFLSKNEVMTIWLGEDPIYPESLSENIRAVFYGFTEMHEIEIKINGESKKYNPNPWEIIEFPASSQKIEEITLTYNNKEIDFTDEYSKIMMNQIYYNHRP